MAAIKISLVADVRSFVSSFKKGTESVEDLVEEVKDLADAGDDTARSMVKDLDKIGEAAEDAQRKTAKIGDGAGGSLKKATDATDEFKDEAKQNFGEVASSFSGDMASAADLVQGTLGGLAGSLGGPLGLALGAVSIALGSFIAMAQAEAERAKEIRAEAIKDVQDAVDLDVDPTRFIASTDQIIEQLETLQETGGKGFELFWEEDTDALTEFQDALEGVGETDADVSNILRLSAKRLETYTDRVREAADADQRRLDILASKRQRTDAEDETYRSLIKTTEQQRLLLGYLDDEIARRNAVEDATKTASDAGLEALQREQEAEEARADAAEENAQRRIDAIAAVRDSVDEAYASMVEDATTFATTEDGALDINKWLTYVQEHAGIVGQYQANLAMLKMSPEDWTALLSMPEDARMQWVSQVASLPEEARTPFIDGLDGIAGNAGSSASVSFEEGFQPDADVEIDVEADTEDAEASIEKVAGKDYTATIKAQTDSSLTTTREALDGLARARTATINVSANLLAVSEQIRNYTPPRITIRADIVDRYGRPVP